MSDPKSPESYSLLTYLWVVGLPVLGGVASYFERARRSRRWSLFELVGEITTAILAGLITFYLCEFAGFSRALTAALVAVAGHAGGKAIALIEEKIRHRLECIE